MELALEDLVKIHSLLRATMNSDNTDYIKERLDEIYKIICANNV